MNWSDFIDERELASLLPGEYRSYARPIKEAVGVFLSGLPSAQQQRMARHQLELGANASLSERLGRLALDSPLLHKLGQTLARDSRLAPELRQRLRPLESLPPTTPLATIERSLRDELGPLDRRGVELSGPLLAEASVAVIVPFVERGVRPIRQGVFKVLKPGIEDQLTHECSMLPLVGAHLDARCHRLGIPQLDYAATFQQVREKLSWEIRLDQEQVHQAAARTQFADEPEVLIPELFDHCTRRVTAMERVFGTPLDVLAPGRTLSRRALAKLIVKAVVAQPFFSTVEPALFHGDPHAGNMMHSDDGRLALLDWSLAGSLSGADRSAIVQLLLAAMTFNGDRIAEVLQRLASGPVDNAALGGIIARRLHRLGCRQPLGMNWLLGLLDEAVQQANLRMSTDLILYRKSLLIVESIVGELSAGDVALDDVLTVEFVRRFVAEWPQRLLGAFQAASPSTRVTNLDLASVLLSLPTSLARWLFNELRRPDDGRRPERSQLGTPSAASVP